MLHRLFGAPSRRSRRVPAAAVVGALLIVLAACNAQAREGASGEDPQVSTTTSVSQVSARAEPPAPAAVVPMRPKVERPNVLVLMTDDQTVESMRAMPLTNQRLVAQGTTFPQSIVTYPLCCPSRASFMTAQYNHNNGVLWNSGPDGGYSSFKGQDTAVPASFQAAGYRTAHIGKFLNGYGDRNVTEIPDGWSSFQGLVGPSTGQYTGFSINDNGVVRTYGDQYQTDVLTDLALHELDGNKDAGAPFFMQVAYLAPHAEFGCALADCAGQVIREDREFSNIGFGDSRAVPSRRFAGTMSEEQLPTKDSYGAVTKGGGLAEDRPALGPLDDENIAAGYRSELESLQSVDESVAALLDRLSAQGRLDNTIVVYTSDNGFFHGEHRLRYGKYLPYEEALTVPLVVRGPGVAIGATNQTVVSNVDVSTTLMAASGVEPLREPDGLDISELWADPNRFEDRALLVEGLGPQDASQPQYLGVRTAAMAYFRFTSDGQDTTELYDLRRDPEQLVNVAEDPRYRQARRALRAITAEMAECAGAQCADSRAPG